MAYSTKHISVGAYGEKKIVDLLRNAGFSANYARNSFMGDVLAWSRKGDAPIKFEVKTAMLGTDNRYQFCLRKMGHTNVNHADFLVLICVNELDLAEYLIIPVSELDETIQKITITNPVRKYKGKYAKYRVQSPTEYFKAMKAQLCSTSK